MTVGADAALAVDGRSVRTLHDDGQVVIELHPRPTSRFARRSGLLACIDARPTWNDRLEQPKLGRHSRRHAPGATSPGSAGPR